MPAPKYPFSRFKKASVGVVPSCLKSPPLAEDDPTEWGIRATLDTSELVGEHEHHYHSSHSGDCEGCISNDDDDKGGCGNSEDSKPQIYGLEWIDKWRGLEKGTPLSEHMVLLVTSDDHLHLWTWQHGPGPAKIDNESTTEATEDQPRKLQEVFSMRLGSCCGVNGGVTVGRLTNSSCSFPANDVAFQEMPARSVTNAMHQGAFGGHRNPHGLIFVFDAAYSRDLATLGVALSDGTVRLLNGQGRCWHVIHPHHFPTRPGYLTALAWSPPSSPTRGSSNGNSMAASLLVTATGRGDVITWQVWPGHSPYCLAIFSGHRGPVFGTIFLREYGVNDEESNKGEGSLLLSWGMDGRLLVWDAGKYGNVTQPEATLLDNAEYPLYSVATSRERIATGGGKVDEGIVTIGVPVHSYRLRW